VFVLNTKNDLKTVENKSRGIKGGYLVDIFMVGVTIPYDLDKIFSLPGDNMKMTDKSDFTISSLFLAESCERIMKNIPLDIYDVVLPVRFPRC